MLSEDEEVHQQRATEPKRQDSGEDNTFEFDVQLKLWRRSKANVWQAPDFG